VKNKCSLDQGLLHAPSERHKRIVECLPPNLPALVLTIGFHLLLVLLWPRERPPASSAQPEVVSVLLQPAARLPSTSSQPQHQSVKKSVPVRPSALRTTRDRTSEVSLPAPSSEQQAVTEPSTSPDVKQVEKADTGAATTIQSGTKFDIDLARRQAGRITRETDAGEARVQIEPNTPWMRLRAGLEAAHVQPATDVQQDSYTAPDGTIVYRKRVGNRTFCRKTGNVGSGGISGIAMNDGAGWVSCPSQAEWKR
jgi:hypothetical protein